jgi:hypothetical protein
VGASAFIARCGNLVHRSQVRRANVPVLVKHIRRVPHDDEIEIKAPTFRKS